MIKMAFMRVNPTRMELTRLKKKLLVAKRGHKLLKDKRDEMMRQFLILIAENRDLRIKVEKAIKASHKSFALVQAEMDRETLKASLLVPKQEISLKVSFRNIVSVSVPSFAYKERTSEKADILPYSFATTSAMLDNAIMELFEIFKDMIHLAEVEKACQIMSYEIEKNNRRVNALEHIIIPDTEENIKYITMKIDENERNNSVRLIKIKDTMIKRN